MDVLGSYEKLYHVDSSVVHNEYATLHRKDSMTLVNPSANNSGCSLFERAIKYLTCRVIATCLKHQAAGTAIYIYWQFYHRLTLSVTYIGNPNLHTAYRELVQEIVYI